MFVGPDHGQPEIHLSGPWGTVPLAIHTGWDPRGSLFISPLLYRYNPMNIVPVLQRVLTADLLDMDSGIIEDLIKVCQRVFHLWAVWF